MVKKAGDGEGTDAAEFWSDSLKIGAGVDFGGEVAFEDAFIRGGASVYDYDTWTYHRVNNQPRYARC